MGIKQYQPTSPGRRGMTVSDFAEVTKKRPEKSLLEPIRKKGGRNSRGVVVSRNRGGGNKRFYRIIDFKRNDRDGITAKVAGIEYDPNRSARIALLHYADGVKRYILAPVGLEVGQHVMAGEKVEPEPGNCMPLASIPMGMKVHCVEMQPGQGARLARSAGMGVTLMAKEGKRAVLLMPSGELRSVPIRCRATIGIVGNIEHSLIKVGKAGKSRYKGRRPHVRGSCQNPVDHPMGGGEGRRAGGRPPCSRTGVHAKGGKTRDPRKASSQYIIRRRKKK
jgi:large subunit ribosomal protein L2